MAKRKRYTLKQLQELESRWLGKLLRAARKVEEFRRRFARALSNEERTRSKTKTVDQVMQSVEPSPAYERTVDVLTVPCMTCDVGPGAECIAKGKVCKPHPKRFRDAVLKGTS